MKFISIGLVIIMAATLAFAVLSLVCDGIVALGTWDARARGWLPKEKPPVLSLSCSGCTAFKAAQWPDALQMTSELLADPKVGWVALEKRTDGTIAVHSTAKHRFERRSR